MALPRSEPEREVVSGFAEAFANEGDRIAAITRFGDTGIQPHFGLPRTLR